MLNEWHYIDHSSGGGARGSVRSLSPSLVDAARVADIKGLEGSPDRLATYICRGANGYITPTMQLSDNVFMHALDAVYTVNLAP